MSGVSLAKAAILRGVRSAFALREPMLVSEWAEKNYNIIGRGNAEPGRWNNNRAPYLRGPMDAICDEHVSKISFMKCERAGGTEAMLIGTMYLVDYAPGPMMYVYPTVEVAHEVNRERVLPTVEKTDVLQRYRTGRRADESVDAIRFKTMTIRFAGSNAIASLEAFGYKYLIKDERDRCRADLDEIIAGRGVTFPGAKEITISTPEDEFTGDPSDPVWSIDRLYKDGDQRHLEVPCPHCFEYHERTWESIRWIGGTAARWEDVARQAWMQCPHCRKEIYGHHNAWQLVRCIWVPSGWTVRGTSADAENGLGSIDGPPSDDAATARPVRSVPLKRALGGHYYHSGSGHASFHLRGYYTPFAPHGNPYGYIAGEFVKKGGVTTRHWVTRRIGDPWAVQGERVKKEELRMLCVPLGQTIPGDVQGSTGYAIGTVPGNIAPSRTAAGDGAVASPDSEIVLLAAFVDVQKTCMYAEVVGFTAHGRRQYLIDALVLPRLEGDGLYAAVGGLDDPPLARPEHFDGVVRDGPLALRTWPLVDPKTGEAVYRTERDGRRYATMPLSVMFIDSGKYAKTEVYQAVRPRQRPFWKVWEDPTKGKRGLVGPRVVATKGFAPAGGVSGSEKIAASGGGMSSKLYAWSTLDEEMQETGGKRRPEDAIKLLNMNVAEFKSVVKDELQHALKSVKTLRDQALAKTDIAAGRALSTGLDPSILSVQAEPRRWFFPATVPEGYFEQLTSEELVSEVVNGSVVKRWKKRKSSAANHFLDCRVGLNCGMLALNIRNVSG